MGNTEAIVKLRTILYNQINSSGLSPIELQYVLNPIINEVNDIIRQQEQDAIKKLEQEANADVEDKSITEDDIEVNIDENEE